MSSMSDSGIEVENSDDSEIAELKGVGEVTVKKLSNAGIHTLLDVLARGPQEIGGILEDQDKARNIVEAARAKLGESGAIIGFQKASQVLANRRKYKRITTSSKELDKLLGGGIETSAVTELYGEFGSSKTQLCLQLAVDVQLPEDKGGLGAKAVYIDTEGTFRPERLVQMAKAKGLDEDEVLDNVISARVYNTAHQELVIKQLGEVIRANNVKLVIIDSAIAHYRAEYLGRGTLSDRQQRLANMLHKLVLLAELNNIAIVYTNQVEASPDTFYGNPIKATGGNVMSHASTYRIYLRKGARGTRVAKIVDSPYHPEEEAVFQVTEDGIVDVESAK
jgi:DNA repair protein RadA